MKKLILTAAMVFAIALSAPAAQKKESPNAQKKERPLAPIVLVIKHLLGMR